MRLEDWGVLGWGHPRKKALGSQPLPQPLCSHPRTGHDLLGGRVALGGHQGSSQVQVDCGSAPVRDEVTVLWVRVSVTSGVTRI